MLFVLIACSASVNCLVVAGHSMAKSCTRGLTVTEALVCCYRDERGESRARLAFREVEVSVST